MDTPISEEGFVGAAIGAAWMGERPVVELQFADFITCAFDPIVTVAAKTHWRSGQADPDHDPLPDRRRRPGRAVPRGLARGLVRRHRRSQDRLPRHRRGRLRVASRRDRGSRPRPLLRAQAALPDAQGRAALAGAPHADRAGDDCPRRNRRDGRHLRLGRHDGPGSRRPGRRGRRGRRPAHDLAARRGDDPRLGGEDLPRPRAAGGLALDRCGGDDPLAARAPLVRAPRRAARAACPAGHAGAVRPRARGRVHALRRLDARRPRRSSSRTDADRALRRSTIGRLRRAPGAVPARPAAAPVRGPGDGAVPAGPRSGLGLHRPRPGGGGSRRRARARARRRRCTAQP